MNYIKNIEAFESELLNNSGTPSLHEIYPIIDALRYPALRSDSRASSAFSFGIVARRPPEV